MGGHHPLFTESQDLDETDLGGRVSWQTSDDRLVQNYVTCQTWHDLGRREVGFGQVSTGKHKGF